MTKGILQIVGTGPGKSDFMSPASAEAIATADFISGYKPYVEQIKTWIPDNAKTFINGMKGEVERVQVALDEQAKGKKVALVCGGDASLYSLASLVFEMASDVSGLEVLPGITAALAASARLGAPVADDLALVSMSDLLTPWETIQKRIEAINLGDFVCAIYNPRSKKRTHQLPFTLEKFNQVRGDLACGFVKHSHRENEQIWTGRISELPFEDIDMSTILIVGCRQTLLKQGKLVTPRGYLNKYGTK